MGLSSGLNPTCSWGKLHKYSCGGPREGCKRSYKYLLGPMNLQVLNITLLKNIRYLRIPQNRHCSYTVGFNVGILK